MYTASYESLERFGKLVADELTNMFEPKSNIVIPITESMAQSLCNDNKLDYDSVSSAFKAYFIYSSVSNYYCNLSSCVFQVIVAYKCVAMRDDAYNEAFCNFLGVSTTELQNIYCNNVLYSHSWEPKQEALWKKTKDFLEKQCNLHLCIPSQKYYAGRYVQYPRSQQLFTTRDLEAYNQQFEKLGLSHEESYDFEYFSSLMFSGGKNVCTCQALLNLAKNQLEEIARKIVFYCFCNWMEKEVRKRGAYNTNKTRKTSEQDQVTIRLNTSERKFSLYLNGKKQLKYDCIQEKILEKPFIYMEAYGDWCLTKKVAQEDGVGVCLYPDQIEAFKKILKGGIIFKSFEDSSIEFISLSPDNWENIPATWKPLVGSNSFFLGGIKDENGFWISGLLPFVLKDKKSRKNYFFVDSIRYDFHSDVFDLNACNLQPGFHYIKLPDKSMAELRIADQVMQHDTDVGWVFWKKEPFFCSVATDWMLSGLNIGDSILAKLKTNKATYWGNDKMEEIIHRFDKIKMYRGETMEAK